MSGDVWLFLGTCIAALGGLAAALYNGRVSKQTSSTESQNVHTVEMIKILERQVEVQDKRLTEFRTRIMDTENQLDSERKLRRDRDQEIDVMKTQLDEIKSLFVGVVPNAATLYPDLFNVRQIPNT